MKKLLLAALVLTSLTATSAFAGGVSVSVGFSSGGGYCGPRYGHGYGPGPRYYNAGYYRPYPVYRAYCPPPPPVYYRPAVVYVQPAPVVVTTPPPTVVYSNGTQTTTTTTTTEVSTTQGPVYTSAPVYRYYPNW